MIDISFIYVFMREGYSQKYLHCYTTKYTTTSRYSTQDYRCADYRSFLNKMYVQNKCTSCTFLSMVANITVIVNTYGYNTNNS